MWHIRVISVVFVFLVNHTISHDECDLGLNSFPKEGNVGQVGVWPWLGIIRVHLHEGVMLRVAVTGAVLVKDKYAIANADDIGKIPKKIFQDESKSFFIPNDELPWTSPLADYVIHPEYEYSTYNTIALIELKLEHNLIPVLPICMPDYLYNASNELYVLGYTDDNKILEKVAYQVQYVEKTVCTEFYKRVGHQERRYIPAHYQCSFAVNNKKNCLWETGMALVSNSSKTWVLIGLGIRGPGCGAPARFIELFPYIPWIESLVGTQQPQYPWRKSADIGITRDIPLHVLFRSNDNNKTTAPPPIGWWDAKENKFVYTSIDRISKDAIIVAKFTNEYQRRKDACSFSTYLVYKDNIQITHMQINARTSYAYYQVSLYDTRVAEYSCIKIQVKAKDYSGTFLAYDVKSNNFDDSFKDITPPYLTPAENKTDTPLEDKHTSMWNDVPNVYLYLSIKFRDKAELLLEVWGPLTTTTKRYMKPWYRTRKKGHQFTKKKGKKKKPEPKTLLLRNEPKSHLENRDNSSATINNGCNFMSANIIPVIFNIMFTAALFPTVITIS